MRLMIGMWSLALVLLLSAGCQSTAGETQVEQHYQQYCFACHGTGAAGAPRAGDHRAWEPRLSKGEAALLKSVTDGMVGMPAKGRCTECTPADLIALIEKMAH